MTKKKFARLTARNNELAATRGELVARCHAEANGLRARAAALGALTRAEREIRKQVALRAASVNVTSRAA